MNTGPYADSIWNDDTFSQIVELHALVIWTEKLEMHVEQFKRTRTQDGCSSSNSRWRTQISTQKYFVFFLIFNFFSRL